MYKGNHLFGGKISGQFIKNISVLPCLFFFFSIVTTQNGSPVDQMGFKVSSLTGDAVCNSFPPVQSYVQLYSLLII